MGQPFPNGSFLPDDLRTKFAPSMRNSRNPFIDEKVVPGPYKEVLPCDDLCYNVVQSCPASMGFQCPLEGDMGFNLSYGIRPVSEDGTPIKSTQITCNYPGAAYFLATGGKIVPSITIVALVLVVTIGIMSI